MRALLIITAILATALSETSSTSVKKIVRRGQPCAVPAVGDRLKDDFGLRYTVTAETLPRMLELAKTLSFTYIK